MIKGIIAENFSLKVLSVVLATALFLFVNRETRSEIGLAVPVELVNLPEDMTIVGQPPSTVYVRVEGLQTRLDAIEREKLVYAIDLIDVREGPATFIINPDELNERLELPRGVRAKSVSPSALSVKLEATERRRLPVEPSFSGELPAQLTVARLTVAPAEVEVHGPSSEVQPLDFVRTRRIDLRGKTGDVKLKPGLEFGGAQISTNGDTRVEVRMTIRPAAFTSTLESVTIETRGPFTLPIRIEPASVDVQVRGSWSAVRRIEESRALTAFVDLQGMDAPGEYERSVEFSYGDTPVTARAEPGKVTVRLIADGTPAEPSNGSRDSRAAQPETSN